VKRSDLELPDAPIDRLVGPIARFLHVQAASGVVLLVAAAAALAIANSPWAGAFEALWNTHLVIGLGDWTLDHSLRHWVSDGLMTIFFFVVGLEVKREIALGELRDPRQAILPVAAAIGGMVVPAVLYLAWIEGEATRGWGIPMATDIAFVVGCLAVLGSRIPAGLRVMLLSVAIVDDIGAILVIAIGYTAHLSLGALAVAGAGLAAVVGLRFAGVRSIAMYVLLGTVVWVAFHESGVHATIDGVLLGLLTPTRPRVSEARAADIVRRAGDLWRGNEPSPSPAERVSVAEAARESVAPLVRIERTLHPWSAFVVMPIFALANAGVEIRASLLTEPVALAIGLGLVVGKPVGIVGMSWLAVRSGLTRLPEGVDWLALLGGGVLSGIGFTMSLFIAGLALDATLLDAAKTGVLCASLVAGVLGMALLVWRFPASRPTG
jgi:Na+:H+ antiporter, NhaA family